MTSRIAYWRHRYAHEMLYAHRAFLEAWKAREQYTLTRVAKYARIAIARQRVAQRHYRTARGIRDTYLVAEPNTVEFQ